MADPTLTQPLLVHGLLTLAMAWPAVRVLRRAGLPAAWALWLLVPLAGPAMLATLLARRPWPTLPPKPEKLHSRERLRREREAAARGAATDGGTP